MGFINTCVLFYFDNLKDIIFVVDIFMQLFNLYGRACLYHYFLIKIFFFKYVHNINLYVYIYLWISFCTPQSFTSFNCLECGMGLGWDIV